MYLLQLFLKIKFKKHVQISLFSPMMIYIQFKMKQDKKEYDIVTVPVFHFLFISIKSNPIFLNVKQ